jgi:chorismate-pyruvate lyase
MTTMHARWIRCRRSVACVALSEDVGAWTPRAAASDPATPPFADPFDRMLLRTDGTVTTLLESCTGEPIVTRAWRQSGPAALDELQTAVGCWWHPDLAGLGLAATERLVARQVTLTGSRSGVAYVAAEALVVPDRLPELLAHRLSRAGASLGRVLADCRLETRREVLDISTVRAGAAGELLGVAPHAALLRRTYTIEVGRRVVSAVTEWLVPGRLAATASVGAARSASPFVVDL